MRTNEQTDKQTENSKTEQPFFWFSTNHWVYVGLTLVRGLSLGLSKRWFSVNSGLMVVKSISCHKNV